MSEQFGADDLTLPIKRTDGENLEERLTGNAYHNILPARYLRKDGEGELAESQEDLFERVARNIALAEAVFEAHKRDIEVRVTPDQVKPDHPRRDELAAEVFGTGTTVQDDTETELTEYNVSKFAYETVVPELPDELREHVESTAAEFQEIMEKLSFEPNSPTLMNAGDELQQLSACIAGDAPVYTRDGLKRMEEVTPGDQVLTHRGQFKEVVDCWSNGQKETVEMKRGIDRGACYDTRLTPDHEVYTAGGEWVRADEVENPADPAFPTGEAFPERLNLTQYTSRLKKQKEAVVDGGRVKLRNADDPRTPEFDQQNNHPTAHVTNDEQLAWLFGLYLAEGDVDGSDLRFTLGADETTLRTEITETVDDVFDLPVSVSESSHGQWVQLRVSSSFVADLFATVLGVGGERKRIPSWVGSADEAYQQALLDGLLAGDGTELESGHRLVLANPTLVYEATLLARSLGHDAVFKKDKQRDLSAQPTSECYISTSEQSRLSNVARRESDTVEVYDMEVADDHSFVVGDFVVHNCFVDSPEDDIDDIHETAKEAAQVFQCLTAETRVHVDGKGMVSIADVEPGDEVRQRDGSGHRAGHVEETHAYDDAPVHRVETEAGVELTGTPNHELLVNGEWTRIDEIESGDNLAVRLGWLPDAKETVELETVDSGGQWGNNRVVSNEEIAALHAEGFSDYEIADQLDCSASTVQRRRANELGPDPNGDGGRKRGDVSFDPDEFTRLYDAGHSDSEIATELGVHAANVGRYRQQQSLEPNGEPVKTVVQPTELTPDLAELVGMWVGDGSKHQDGIRFHLNREENLEHADHLCRRLFDEGLDWRWDEGCYDAVLHSHEVKRWWLTNFGDAKPEATSASVPDQLWSADNETVGAFLRGLFSTDGSLQRDRYPRLWTASDDLRDGVQQLLLGLGIPALVWESDSEEREYYNVGPTSERGLRRFANLVGFSHGRDEKLVAALEETDFRGTTVGTVRNDNTWEVPVESVEEAGTDTVYDVTVTDDPEYVANSVVSHNSGGGMGYAFWQLRPYGDPVGSTGGIASGPITFMRTFDQMCETIAQGGARRGAQMGVMRVSHPDVIQFIHAKNKDVSLANTLRLNDPDDFTHTSFAEALEEARELIDEDGRVPEHLRNAVEGHLSNFNISVGITDSFMEAVKHDESYTFTNPRTEEPHVATAETVELYEMFGLGEHVAAGEELSVPAREIWDHIIEGAHENGEPGVVYLERINKQHSFDVEEHPDHQILATNPSLAAGTKVLTDQGIVDIENLEGSRVEVPTVGGEWADAICHRSGDNETLYEVELANGKTYLATEEHKWPVLQEGSYERTKTTALERGQRLPIQHRESLRYGSVGDRDEGFLVGWLYRDGSVTHRKDGRTQYGFTFSQEDANSGVMDRVLGTLEDITGVEYEPTERQRDGKPWYEVHASHADLRHRMAEYGVEKKQNGIPEVVWKNGSESFRKGFVDGLFSADGYVDSDGNRIVLVSSKEDLIKDVSDLLGFYGIKTSLRDTELKRWDESYDRWDLKLSRTQAHRFRETFDLSHEAKSASLAALKTPDRDNVLSNNVTIESVRPANESDPVWDLRVDEETHTFALSHAFTGNCGEQPLEEYEACNLGHINLSTLAAEDAPDWRVWSERHADEYATQEATVEAFLEEAVDFAEFDRRIELGTRFLENVVTMSDFPVEEIEQTVREMRKIGLGIMGLAQLYIQLGVKYGSDTADEIARQLMVHINHESKQTSHDLAEERGVFEAWDESKYADPTEYREWFEHHTGLDADEWADGFPIRNHNSTTIAPTGCVEENSLLSTDEGLQRIKDLDGTTAEFEQWDEVEIGVSTDGGTQTATAVYDNGFADVRRIETEGGFSVTSTPDHRFRVLSEDGEYVWKPADEFSPGDRILLQRDTFDDGTRRSLDTSESENYHWNSNESLRFPSEMTPELAEFLGYFMGDGYVHEDVGVTLVVESDAEELDAYLRELGESVFGVAPTVEDRDTRHVLIFGGRHLPRYFEDNGWKKDDGNEGERAASAFVPEEILAGTERIATAFLRGLFEADGTASREVELSTASATLADQVQTLLLSIGIVFAQDSIETEEMHNHYDKRRRYSVRGATKREDVRFLDEVGFITKSNELELTPQSYKNDTYPPAVVNTIRSVDGYDSVSDGVRKRVNQSPINGAVSRKLVRDVEKETGATVRVDGRRLLKFYAATVESVEDDVAYTKDISVPSNNTYIANGFVTHNTTSMVGNTTGGCEPIYNVAYYKNVSDDVQGEEMLVEFDDYFLRVLEDNDIDVETVKEEAKAQMAENEFDGVEGLSTVPDAIGELFVTTGDLSAKQHASVQTACQKGVDSSISKTINAPNDATVEDAKEAFEYIYDNGGKGVTYYRDGTRSKQVLTTRAQNTEFAGMDDEEAVEFVVEQIEEVFGGIEGFLESEEVRERLSADIEELFAAESRTHAKKKPRPDQLHGVTQRIDTGYGKLYVTINEDPETGEPFELFANTGHSGGFTNSFTDALAKTISVALRSGVDPYEIVDKLQGIRSPKVAWDKGEQINSIPDAFGTSLRRYLDDEIDTAYPDQATLEETATERHDERTEHAPPETDGAGATVAQDAADIEADHQSVVDAGENPECPNCGSLSLYYSEGCKTCESCGWSEC